MPDGSETRDESVDTRRTASAPVPGVVAVFSAGRPLLAAAPLEDGVRIVGRGDPLLGIEDRRVSREHARVELRGDAWVVRELGSRNGTRVDGFNVEGEVSTPGARVLRVGQTVLLLCRDVRPYRGAAVVSGEQVVGPTLRSVLDKVASAARASETLLVLGESGSGKEMAARAFHASGPSSKGPFIAVNCAAIPVNVAERLLFGAKKGAFSGADEDVDGYLQAADGGVLFLDEVGELDLEVQAKLLRTLETREVLALGANKPRKVSVRICAATHRDLRAAVTEGRFREDLYYRIAQPSVMLPPLRERPEDIAWLAARETARLGALALNADFVEACLLRPWPGNIRELLAELRRAAQEAFDARDPELRAERLGPMAGRPLEGPIQPTMEEPPGPTRRDVERALEKTGGNVAEAARKLGLHRTQLYRLMKRLGVLRPG
jgi:transcriptional regulator with GAF, ATPase, and Fis domain